MNEPKSIEEVPNWVIVNALKCPVDARISIVAKLLQSLDHNQINQALSISGVSNYISKNMVDCGNCGEKVEMIPTGEMCPKCYC